MHGHVPAAVRRSPAIARLASSTSLDLTIGLPLRNQAALSNLVLQVCDPASPQYQHYLTPNQFTARFGPTEADYQAVIAFAQASGLAITGTHPNRTLLNVRGTVAQIEQVLGVHMKVYSHPWEARSFYATDVEPSLDLAVRVLTIDGLDNFIVPHPMNLKMKPFNSDSTDTPALGSGPGGTLRGKDFRSAYAPGVTLDGTGQVAGIFSADGYYSSDITSYENLSGLPRVTLQNVLVDGFDGNPGSNNNEVALDIEMVISMAPGLAKLIVYEGPNKNNITTPNNVLNRMATDNLARQLSCSWAFRINSATEQIFQQFILQGQSFFQASGDSGAYAGAVDTPSDNPNITVVGGTTLTMNGTGDTWASEKAWSWFPGQSSATGGGYSTTYGIPSWQQGLNLSTNQSSTIMRNIPDVAMAADNISIKYNNGSTATVGGTSAAAPLWAGFIALVNQQAAVLGKSPVGFINPVVYGLGAGPNYAAVFHDITSGNNTNSSSRTKFFAVSGYDLCTGWGTPRGSNLINALIRCTLTLNASPAAGGSISVSPPPDTDGKYAAFTVIRLTSNTDANGGYNFNSWSGDLSGVNNPASLVMDGDRTVTANYSPTTPATLAYFGVDGVPSPLIAGTPASLTITAYDANMNVFTGYTGTITFTSSDKQAILPVNGLTFGRADAGIRTFTNQVIFKTAGVHAITVADSISTTITGYQSGMVVNPGQATSLVMTQPPGDTPSGATITPAVLVQVVDPFGNPVIPVPEVSISINKTAGAGLLSGTATKTTTNGLAVFNDLAIDTAGACQLAAQSPPLWPVASGSFQVLSQALLRAQADSDGDGFTDFQENLAGTDPRDPASFPHLVDVRLSGQDAILSFVAVSGRVYTIESKDTLDDIQSAWQTRMVLTNSVDGLVQSLDPGAADAASHRFYRLVMGPNREVVSEPAGFYCLPLLPGPNAISVPLHKSAVARGWLAGVNGNTVTLNLNPGWAANALAPANEWSQYYLLARQDVLTTPGREGDWWPILSNASDTITLKDGLASLGGFFAAGDQVEIRPCTSLQDLFGSGSAFILQPDQDGAAAAGDSSRADVIRFIRNTSFGPPIYYHDGTLFAPGWYYGHTGPLDGSTLTVMPGQAFMLFRPLSVRPTNLVFSGQVQSGRLTQYLQPGPNAMGMPFAGTAPVGSSNLKDSGWVLDSDASAATGDYSKADLIRPVIGASFGPSIYYHDGTLMPAGWYSGGVLNYAWPLEPGHVSMIFITGPNARIWRQAVPY